MPRKKKDGRYINYYLDRQIYERLERYADDKGQQMPTAIERILKEHLDKYEAALNSKGGLTMFCSNCNLLTSHSRCPACGSRDLRQPTDLDFCFLCEKETIWSAPLSDILNDNHIPFVTRNVLGAGLAAKMGPALERIRFYVPYLQLETAQKLELEFFSAEDTLDVS